jgi:hypothetical protein
MNLDYTIFYKKKFEHINELENAVNYDLLISAYNDSERVRAVFEKTSASEKHWLILPEYGYEQIEYPNAGHSKVFPFGSGLSEGEVIRKYFAQINPNFNSLNVCVDISGFLRPHLIFLIRFLAQKGIKKADFFYSLPIEYSKKEETSFTGDYINVRQVEGCQGSHNPEVTNDFLIIGSGYDDRRITDVAKAKSHAHKVQIFGLPSLQPDMYQENVLRAYKAEEDSTKSAEGFINQHNTFFSPAYDPFVTASLIQRFCKKENSRKEITNLYLSPLATKAQALGFALYYVWESIDKPVSIIFPFCREHFKNTTSGISKIWRYTVEFPPLFS